MSDCSGSPADLPGLDVLASSDRLFDALAARESVDFADSGDDELAALLVQWRDELRWPPASALVSEDEAIAALESGLAARGLRRRGMVLTGSVAAAVLAFGGFGVMVGDAQPGDSLYSMHTLLFGEAPSVHDDQIELAAKTELAKVQQMIAQGDWQQAQDRLAAVNDTLQDVNDADRKQNLIDQVNELNAKVSTHDPDATLPPAPPSASVPASEPDDPSADPGDQPGPTG